jgi:hypothetical protein
MGLVGHETSPILEGCSIQPHPSRMVQKGQGRQLPGINWAYTFLSCHPELKLRGLTGLDLKHAQNLNPL